MDLSLTIHYDKSYIGVFKDTGITESEKVVEVQRSDLVAELIGGTASKTAKVIKKAEGGVLFVDEAYNLCSPSERDFGKEAVQTLMANVNSNVNPNIKNPIMIFAVYKEQVNDFMKMNPCLTRRVKTVLNFAILLQRNFVTSQNVKSYNSLLCLSATSHRKRIYFSFSGNSKFCNCTVQCRIVQ